jgi:hypothetical protein
VDLADGDALAVAAAVVLGGRGDTIPPTLLSGRG